jgi:hypothetical protein
VISNSAAPIACGPNVIVFVPSGAMVIVDRPAMRRRGHWRFKPERRESAHGKKHAQGLATGVEAACLRIMDGISAGRRPIDRGVVCVRGWPRLKVRRRPRLKVRKWPRLTQVVVVMMVVTMRRFLSEGIARKAGRQSDRSDKAFDHQSVFPMRKRRASLGRVPTSFVLKLKLLPNCPAHDTKANA